MPISTGVRAQEWRRVRRDHGQQDGDGDPSDVTDVRGRGTETRTIRPGRVAMYLRDCAVRWQRRIPGVG